MKISKEQLRDRSVFEIVLSYLYLEFREIVYSNESCIRNSLQRTEEFRVIQSIFKSLLYNYRVLHKEETEIDELGILHALSASFAVEDNLKKIISFLKFEETLHIPEEYKDSTPDYLINTIKIIWI